RLIALFESFPDCPDLSAARPVPRLRGYRDYPNLVRRPVHRGAAFVGDAALSLDPMSGVGCSFAMTTADMAADALAEVLVPGETPAPDAVD
ncbi:NAD(P)/FAD-dependent oxidoreductase, partial [Tritonibacter sp. SIMBA_163]|uniref:NAD(P)/FAD-dependent oxidoreductase n=1 Tax=Tritonibacter sp. SIMBA_163 TaxID=3080868 RepID=UPI0039802A43